MIGSIAGDIIGSTRELGPIKTKDFELFEERSVFTDDTVMTVAVAKAYIFKLDYAKTMQEYGLAYPQVPYGKEFRIWLKSDNPKGYNSWGNGAAMRVGALGNYCRSEDEVLMEAKRSAIVSHSHEEGVRGAQAAALAVFYAKGGRSKEEIRKYIQEATGYDLSHSVDEIRPGYSFRNSCQHSVPQAICCFLDSVSFEDAIRNAVSLGGDSDTLACIAGSIAEAYYGGVPPRIFNEIFPRLPKRLMGDINTCLFAGAKHQMGVSY